MLIGAKGWGQLPRERVVREDGQGPALRSSIMLGGREKVCWQRRRRSGGDGERQSVGVEGKGGDSFRGQERPTGLRAAERSSPGRTEEHPFLFSPEGTAVSPKQSSQQPWGWESGWRPRRAGAGDRASCRWPCAGSLALLSFFPQSCVQILIAYYFFIFDD